ncbi:Oidioi.mRNA.OKI2018_I69.PAR.g11605.t1.cds [Oikopleura dioica]|uniref:Oidioi.mRNA.OKI2018_I69.PAR.g11605.t1.cds n=1 Tax=Oikopleura dioica TaxID=34765 RepID=A0ABN7S2T9_OIKDI|nr:Oidioi.mRNA.OKI2018_I69.PAR.g11605.t1.cds [Oikopleura dioica]
MEERNRPRNIIPQVAIQRYEQTRQGNRLTDEGTLSENKSLAVGHGCYLSFEKNRLMMLADSHPLIYFVRHDNQVIGNSSIDVGFKNTVALFPDDNQLELIFKNAAKPNEGPIQIFITKNQ